LYGPRLSGRVQTASNAPHGCFDLAIIDAAAVFAFANFAAYSPGTLAETMMSDNELPPIARFAPLIPAAHSPAANSPGMLDICVSESTADPRPLRSALWAHFHRLFGNVDVANCLNWWYNLWQHWRLMWSAALEAFP